MTKEIVPKIAHLLVWLFLFIRIGQQLLPVYEFGSSFGIYYDRSGSRVNISIIDFAFHFNCVQKAWTGQTTVKSGHSIYSPENLIKVTSEWAGQPVFNTLHFGYFPTILVLLGPLALFTHSTAYLLFNTLSLLAVFWMTRPSRTYYGTGVFMFIGGLADACFALGQSSIVTSIGLLYLAELCINRGKIEGWGEALLGGAVIWALSAKPPLALVAIVALGGLRQWKILVVGFVMILATSIILTPWIGVDWLGDYIRLIRSYDKIHAGSQFAWTIHNEYMTNLRALLSVDLGMADDAAGLLSGSIWVIILIGIFAGGLHFDLAPSSLWSLGILSYLLFCPHVTPTEVLHLVVIMAITTPKIERLSLHQFILSGVLLLTVYAGPFPGTLVATSRWPQFLMLSSLFLFFVLYTINANMRNIETRSQR